MNSEPSPAERPGVLLVEDSATQRLHMQMTLAEHGWRVAEASNGIDALTALHRESFDVVVTDIHMPGMDGYELCREIRADERLRNTAVVLLTTPSDGVEHLVEGLLAKADKFVAKPWSEESLVGPIGMLLEGRRCQNTEGGLEFTLPGQGRYTIDSEVPRVVDFLLSIFETAFERNRSLSETQRELSKVNDHLEELAEKRAQDLQESEAKYRAIFEAASDGVVTTDENGTIESINFAGKRIFGSTEHAMRGVCLGDLIPGLEFPLPAELLAGDEQFEIQATRRDGSEFALECAFASVQIGNQPRLSGIFRDISLRKNAEETLKKANERLTKLDQLKSDFIATVSHEIRTPLTSMRNAIAIMETGRTGKPTEGQRRFLAMARRNIERLGHLVGDLLDFSKLESGSVRYQFEEADILGVVTRTFESFEPHAASRSLDFRMESAPPDLPAVYIDDDRIEQVLVNLLNNAMKFTSEGGSVSISVRATAGGVEVSVSDSGPGISHEDRDRIFDRFQQVEDSLTREFSGVGLGLAITKRLIADHRGTIDLESELGSGSRFFFTLPAFTPALVDVLELDAEIATRLHEEMVVSILVLDLGRQDGFRDLSVESYQRVAARIVKTLRNALPRTGDQIHQEESIRRVVVLMTGTPKAGARTVQLRLEQVLARDPIEIEGESFVPVIRDPLTLPEDRPILDEILANLSSLA